MKDLEKEIKEAISKNLPQTVGEELRKRLDQADQEAELLRNIKIVNDGLNVEIKNLNEIISEYKKKDWIYNQNLEVSAKIEKEQRDLIVKELTYKLECEKEKTDFTKNVALGLVRNIDYRKTIFDKENQDPYCDSNGVWHYPNPVNKNFEETKKAE